MVEGCARTEKVYRSWRHDGLRGGLSARFKTNEASAWWLCGLAGPIGKGEKNNSMKKNKNIAERLNRFCETGIRAKSRAPH